MASGPTTWRFGGRSPRRMASMPAGTHARAPTATGFCGVGSRARSSAAGRSGGRTASIPERSKSARRQLLGTHDFTAFTPARNDHVRFQRDVLRAEWVEESSTVVCFWIEADAFMHNMVRILVGTMLEVGSGRRTVADFDALLGGLPRENAGETAPAHGLYLASVAY